MEEVVRNEYIRALETQSQVPLYAESWWLDAACGHNGWNVLSAPGPHGSISLPYQYFKIRGLDTISNPPFTQFLPLIKTGQVNEIPLENLFQNLPRHSILDITIRDSVLFENATLPKAQLRYSYVLETREGMELIRSKYNAGLRRNVKDAADTYDVTESDDVQTLIELCNATYRARGLKAPAWIAASLPDITASLIAKKRGKMKIAWHNGQPIAGILTGWDDVMRYYLAGGRTSHEGGASAHSLLLDDAIADASVHNQNFDFEGSMHPGIALFFQSFGGKPRELWRIRNYKGFGKLWSLFHS